MPLRGRTLAILCIFFLSGVAGLSYELTWLRYLIDLFGATTPAVSATVSIFFTGLALGAALGGRFFDRQRNPAVAYAVLEIAIGVTAAGVPFLFEIGDDVLGWVADADSPALLVACATAVLIVPTTLLGATFPAMAAVLRGESNTTRSTALFYGINTLGAVVGCLVSSFYLIPEWGPANTNWGLVGVNLCAAACIFVHGRMGDAAPPRAAQGPVHVGWHYAALATVSGFLAIATEVLWTRALALSFPATVYVFALILSAYLVGIGVGSLAVAAATRNRTPRINWLSALYVAIGGGSAILLSLLPQMGPWSLALLSSGGISTWTGWLAWMGGGSVLVMLPATVAMGAALPVLIGLATKDSDNAAAVAGRLYALNTVAGVAGSLIATFLVMPALGLSTALLLCAIGYLGLALSLWNHLPRVARLGLATIALTGLAVCATGLAPEVNPLRYHPDRELLFYEDAPSGTISIQEDGAGVRALRVNNQYGLSETSQSTVEMQYTLGHLPMMLHPAPKRALLIGFATGTTLSAMAEHPAQVECVELHPTVVRVAPWFSDANQSVYDRRNVTISVDDGRRYLARSKSAYDVVVGDLYLPKNPGVGSMFSAEHFASVAAHLSPDGVFVAWLPLFQLGPQEFRSVVAAFLTVFPQAEAWVGNWPEGAPVLGLVSRRTSALPQFDHEVQERVGQSVSLWKKRPTGSVLVQPDAGGTYPSRRLLDTAALRALAEGAPVNRQERPIVEFSAPRSMMEANLTGVPLAKQNLDLLAPYHNQPRWRGTR